MALSRRDFRAEQTVTRDPKQSCEAQREANLAEKCNQVSAVIGAGGIEVRKFRMSSFYGNAYETGAVVALLDCCE